MFITFPAVLCIALPSSHMLEGFQGAVCIGKLPFFFPWSEGKAVSLNGLNDLSPLLIHDNSSIFRKSLGKRLLALFRLAVSYLPYLCLSVTSSFSSLCAWVCINCYVPEISPSIRLQSRHCGDKETLCPYQFSQFTQIMPSRLELLESCLRNEEQNESQSPIEGSSILRWYSGSCSEPAEQGWLLSHQTTRDCSWSQGCSMEMFHLWAALASGITCCMVVNGEGAEDQKSQEVMNCNRESALALV